MATRSHPNLSIIEAVETLSSIADLEFDREIGIAQKHEMVLDNEKVAYKTVHWLHKEDANTTVNLVKETFRVILHYLRQFYRREYGYVTDPKTVEGIKTIMVLVGEAAKKLDKYTQLFHETHNSVTDFKEYRQLQDFYLSRIARKVDEGVLGKWILGLSLGKLRQPNKNLLTEEERSSEVQHVFVDLETVKRDTEYELFFIRKEDGSRFFSPRLLRNIKLVCDFGDYFGEHKQVDLLENLKQWQDRILHTCARNILKALGSQVEYFFHEIRKSRDHELVDAVSKTLMALMLSSHAHNLIRYKPAKTCAEYFGDFQIFLREALHTRSYQRWVIYPPKESNKLGPTLLDILHTICRALYVNLEGLNEMVIVVHELIREASLGVSKEHAEVAQASHQLWNQLASDHTAMNKMIKRHPNGPLLKVLDILEEDAFHVFDPLLQHNIPNELFDLYINDQRIIHNRFASPVYQEFINKVTILEEFKGFLRNYQAQEPKKRHLLINLQDSTSWREHARCAALEDLQLQPEMNDALTVVTLATDTDFYHQLAPYHQFNHADAFIKQFKEHLMGQGSGFYFPPSIDSKELKKFADRAMEHIHTTFFSGKNVLLRDHRLDFIEIFYMLLQLKLIDWVKPSSFSLTCKDGLDIGQCYSSLIYIFMKLMNPEGWNQDDVNYVNFMLYGPALFVRERILLPERFNRMLSALKMIENARQEFGTEYFNKVINEGIGLLYDTPILQAQIYVPR